MSADARSAMLARIRSANGHATDLTQANAGWERIPRPYLQSSQFTRGQVIDLFEERLLDYDAHVVHCRKDAVPSAIRNILVQRELSRPLVPAGFPAEFLPAGIGFTVDSGFSAPELDGFDAAITQSAVAIAETGTLVLAGTAGQGRRAMSLVPDVHLCLVRMEDVVATVPEAWLRLQTAAALPLTLISGPSATADIEMTRIKGVHGPRHLHVLLLNEG